MLHGFQMPVQWVVPVLGMSVKDNFAKTFLYLLGSYWDWLYHYTLSLWLVVLILKSFPKVLPKKCSLLSAQQVLAKCSSGGVAGIEVTWNIWRAGSLKFMTNFKGWSNRQTRERNHKDWRSYTDPRYLTSALKRSSTPHIQFSCQFSNFFKELFHYTSFLPPCKKERKKKKSRKNNNSYCKTNVQNKLQDQLNAMDAHKKDMILPDTCQPLLAN